APSTRLRTRAGSRFFMSAPSRQACAALSSRTLRLPECDRYPVRAVRSGEPDARVAANDDLVGLGAGRRVKGADQAAYLGKRERRRSRFPAAQIRRQVLQSNKVDLISSKKSWRVSTS